MIDLDNGDKNNWKIEIVLISMCIKQMLFSNSLLVLEFKKKAINEFDLEMDVENKILQTCLMLLIINITLEVLLSVYKRSVPNLLDSKFNFSTRNMEFCINKYIETNEGIKTGLATAAKMFYDKKFIVDDKKILQLAAIVMKKNLSRKIIIPYESCFFTQGTNHFVCEKYNRKVKIHNADFDRSIPYVFFGYKNSTIEIKEKKRFIMHFYIAFFYNPHLLNDVTTILRNFKSKEKLDQMCIFFYILDSKLKTIGLDDIEPEHPLSDVEIRGLNFKNKETMRNILYLSKVDPCALKPVEKAISLLITNFEFQQLVIDNPDILDNFSEILKQQIEPFCEESFYYVLKIISIALIIVIICIPVGIALKSFCDECILNSKAHNFLKSHPEAKSLDDLICSI
jgi:hypothetical protein